MMRSRLRLGFRVSDHPLDDGDLATLDAPFFALTVLHAVQVPLADLKNETPEGRRARFARYRRGAGLPLAGAGEQCYHDGAPRPVEYRYRVRTSEADGGALQVHFDLACSSSGAGLLGGIPEETVTLELPMLGALSNDAA